MQLFMQLNLQNFQSVEPSQVNCSLYINVEPSQVNCSLYINVLYVSDNIVGTWYCHLRCSSTA